MKVKVVMRQELKWFTLGTGIKQVWNLRRHFWMPYLFYFVYEVLGRGIEVCKIFL